MRGVNRRSIGPLAAAVLLAVGSLMLIFLDEQESYSYEHLQRQLSTINNNSQETKVLNDHVQVTPIPPQYEKSHALCQKKNTVLDRGHAKGTDRNERPHSVTNYTFANFHHNKCDSLEDTLLAIKNGSRRWVNASHESLPPLQKENFQSYFVPHGCDLPIMSPKEICQTLNQHSHLILTGDSITRQMMQGLSVAMSGDLDLGATDQLKGSQDKCRCDGQFSELNYCRSIVVPTKNIETCSLLPESKSEGEVQSKKFRLSSLDEVQCDDPNSRSVIYVLQGGSHHRSSATTFFNKVVYPILSNPTFVKCRELKKLKMIWLSFGSQSRALDGNYPYQSRENALNFNLQMESKLKKHIEDIVIVDLWSLSADGQTSDGFHFLTDINLVEANLLMHIMSYL